MRESDKLEIRKIIQEELKLALVRTVTIERGPRQQGDPEKVIKEEEWNVLDFMAAYAPKIEASLRGLQADVDRAKNKVLEQDEKLNAIGLSLLGLEKSARALARLTDLARLGLPLEHKLLIEDAERESDPS